VDANERTGSDGPGGPLDDYAATDSTQFNIGNPVFTKSLAEPSQTHTTPPNVTIGEVFYYELGVNLPEGTTPTLVVTDTLPVGLEFVSGSNALVTTTNPVGTCQPTSLSANFSGAVAAPTLNLTAPAAGVHGGILEFVFTSITVPGDNVTNNNAFALCFQAVVTNTAGNQNGTALTNTAEAVSGPWTAAPVSVVVDVVEPELQVTKSVSDATPALDDTITYTLLVEHTGASSAEAFDVLVTDAIPAGLVYVSGSISAPAGWAVDASAAPNLSFTCASPACSLPLGSTASLTYQVQADPANQPALGATLTNNAVLTWTSLPATVTGERTGGGGVDDYRDTTTVDISFAGVSLVLTKDDGGVTVAPGDTIAYTLNVLNDGNADATNVVISDTIPTHTTFNATASTAGWTCAAGFCTFTIPTLAVNASQNVTFAVDVDNPLPAGVDQIDNTASVRGDHNPATEPTLVDNIDTETTPVTAGPALEITKDDGLTIVSPGTTLTYAILVSNTGNQAATGVVITDTLPTGLTFVSAANGGTHSSGVITWTVGTLPAGSSFSTSLTAKVDNPLPSGVTSLTNLAEVSDDGTNTGGVPIVDSTTDTDNLIDQPDSDKTLVGSSHTHTATPGAAVGEILTYRVTLSIPPGDLLNLTATDLLDQGLAYVDCTVPVGPNLTTTLPGSWADVCPVAAGDIRPEPSGSAAAVDQARRVIFRFGSVSNATASLQTLTLEYRVVVLNSAANTAINTPSLNNDVLWEWTGGNTSASATPVQVVEPDLEIFKEVDSQVAVNGQVLTFKITVDHTTQSNADAFDVVMADMIPAGLTYVPGSLAYFSGQAPTTLIDATAPMLNVVWDTLLNNGQPSVVTFKAVYGGNPVVNTASVAWTSLPGDVTAPQTPNNTLSTERSYDPGDDVNVYGSSSQIGISNPDLPATGFAPGIITDLPQQPENYSYQNLDGIWLEIPGLGVSVPLVGIPLNEAGWDLTWLGNQAGYLEGTAYPSYTGNTAITAHAYLSNGKPGPFANLYNLRWGQKVILHAYGYRYVYEVRRVREVKPDDTSALRHEDRAWLSLLTCRYFNEKTGQYGARSLVQAVLVDVQPEQARP
jgi:LPXTG-site transpeptidase (sortase) family protein